MLRYKPWLSLALACILMLAAFLPATPVYAADLEQEVLALVADLSVVDEVTVQHAIAIANTFNTFIEVLELQNASPSLQTDSGMQARGVFAVLESMPQIKDQGYNVLKMPISRSTW